MDSFIINWCSSTLVPLVKGPFPLPHPPFSCLFHGMDSLYYQLVLKYVNAPSERPLPPPPPTLFLSVPWNGFTFMINGCSRTLVPLVKDPPFPVYSMGWIPFNDQLMLEYISTLSERPPLSSLFHGNGFTFMINGCSSLLVALVKDHPIRVYLLELIHFYDNWCSSTLVPLTKVPAPLLSVPWNGFTFMIDWCSSTLVPRVKDHPIPQAPHFSFRWCFFCHVVVNRGQG